MLDRHIYLIAKQIVDFIKFGFGTNYIYLQLFLFSHSGIAMQLELRLVCLLLVISVFAGIASGQRTFQVDYDHNRFLKDGEPFRFISGSFHYFRAHPDTWARHLRTMRAAGLNAVTT